MVAKRNQARPRRLLRYRRISTSVRGRPNRPGRGRTIVLGATRFAPFPPMRAIRAGGRSSREVPGPRAAKDWRMQTDGSSAPSDDFRLRLAWDGDNEGDEEPGAGRSPRKAAARAAAAQGRRYGEGPGGEAGCGTCVSRWVPGAIKKK